MLHTINKSPFEKNSFDSCLRLAGAGSAILLIEDAVYAAVKRTSVSEKLRQAKVKSKVYVLGPDLKARGMDRETLVDGIEIVDYGGFVDLVIDHRQVQSWL